MYYDFDEDREHRFSGKVPGNGKEPAPLKLAKMSGISDFLFVSGDDTFQNFILYTCSKAKKR